MPILNSKGGPNLGEDDNTSQQSHPAAHPAPAAVQSDAQPQVQTKPCAEKVPRPQIKMGIVQDEFSYFKNRWLSYNRSCGIMDETEVRDQLRSACHEDLNRCLYNCLGTKMESLTEQQMLDQIEKLAVLAQNNLVNLVHLPVKALYARLKANASVC